MTSVVSGILMADAWVETSCVDGGTAAVVAGIVMVGVLVSILED